MHPIEAVMRTAMENLRSMVDVQTIVGDPVTTPDGTVIVPVSKVQFGYAAGGSDWAQTKQQRSAYAVPDAGEREGDRDRLPFGGGSGGGVSIVPVAFLVVGTQGVRVVPLETPTRTFERIVELVPQIVDKFGARGKSPVSMSQTV
ncbi:MAG: GerW family sporulation protein [Paenibacillaceae bacterium]|jgi:sporulation protein YtfJ|nr:GerW family sporulation protein [Paenibacillaceae bacterium]